MAPSIPIDEDGEGTGAARLGSAIYREFRITFDPPPIPVRNCDWHAVHVDYDGPGDSRLFHAASEDAVRADVDEWHDERSALAQASGSER